MSAARHISSRTAAAALMGFLLPVAAAAQEAERMALAGGSPREKSLVIAVVAGLFVVGVLTARLLIRAGLTKSLVWTGPILAVLYGGAWAAVAIAAPHGCANLSRIVLFLFLFFVFVSALYGGARLVMPSEAQRTRAGVSPFMRNCAVAVVAFLGLLVLLTWCFPGIDLTPLFITSGVVSIVVGLAVQGLLSNLLAGVVISVERPFKVGDWVRIGDSEGEVAHINWRATRLRTRFNDYVEIPNSVIAQERVTNFDEPTPQHLCKILVGVSYATPPALAVRALTEAALRAEGVLKNPPPIVRFVEYQDFSLLYALCVWIDNYASLPAIESDVRKEIWYSFKRHGIVIPFPIRDVNVRQVQEEPQETRARLVAVAGLLRGATYELEAERTLIGRNPASQVWLTDQHVSNEHAVIERSGGRFLLRDLGSRHGTLLNGQPVESAELSQGDEITVGPVTFVFEMNLRPPTPRPTPLRHPGGPERGACDATEA